MGISLAVLIGMVLAVVGVIDGVDFRCFSHPLAGTGVAIVVICVMLGIVIGLSGAVAGWALVRHPAESGTG